MRVGMGRRAEEIRPVADGVKASSELEVDDARVLIALAGPNNEKLKALERAAGVTVGTRGHKILLEGSAADVALAERFLVEVVALAREGVDVHPSDIARALRALQSEPHVTLRDMFDEVLALAPGRRPVGPRGLAQKRY